MGTKDLSGKSFEREVADAYRALGYAVTANDQVNGKQTDLLARREVDGAPTIALAVECKDTATATGNAEVAEFVARVIGQRSAGVISAGTIVSRVGFTAPARAVAGPHNFVSLLTWDDLTSVVLDVRSQLRDAVQQYENSDIFEHYLPLTLERLSWDTMTSAGARPISAQHVLQRWFDSSAPESRSPSFVVVLADFGAGKSTLLRRVHYERAVAFLNGTEVRVPLFVPLRQFRDTRDVTALLRMAFREAYFRDLPSDLLWQRINAGIFYLLLDGFDEMTERSDAERRLALCEMLLPLVSSRCPVILTSRPSHFVERGELNRLLGTLSDAETQIGGPGRDHLRRELVNRFRETRPARHMPRIATQGADVYRLRPLTRSEIKAFVGARGAQLRHAKSSPAAVVRFIERTYDLSDLATRPMLLAFIVESVIIGALDPRNTDELGAAGLYEQYTQAKLELDLAKGPTRAGGLSVDLRRRLAEDLAVALYSKGVLETDFEGILPQLMSAAQHLPSGSAHRQLSPRELATDFATSSFITLTEDGRCRFVHKSFRGFFVARVIKGELSVGPHELLDVPLEQEVLYFLGGFAPTESQVATQLWSEFQRADAEPRRRNLLGAFLYTRPRHARLEVRRATVSDVRFGKLSFVESRWADVRWHEVAVQELHVADSEWRNVCFDDSHLARMDAATGRFDVGFTDSTVEALALRQIWQSACRVDRSMIDGITTQDSDLRLTGSDARVVAAVVGTTRLSLDGRDFVVDDMSLAASRLTMTGAHVTTLSGQACMVEIPDETYIGGGQLVDSLVVIGGQLKGSRSGRALRSRLGFAVQGESVVVCRPSARLASPAGIAGGVFGPMQNLGGVSQRSLKLWGVVHSDDLLDDGPDPKDLRVDNLIVTSERSYKRALRPQGALCALLAVDELTARRGAFTEKDRAALAHLLADLRQAWLRIAMRGSVDETP